MPGCPGLLLSILVFLWGTPSLRTLLDGGDERAAQRAGRHQQVLAGRCPHLHDRVYRTAPVVRLAAGRGSRRQARRRDVQVQLALDHRHGHLSGGRAVGVLAADSAGRLSPRVLSRRLAKMRWALLTIACMLALAFVTKYSGSDATLGLAFTKTGWLYPFFAPLLGWLGVALTGSDTSSNALFGSLQRITAEQLGLNPVLIVASNSTGGVMGKMIDAQSIVVAAVATEQSGGEGKILRFVFWHSIALAVAGRPADARASVPRAVDDSCRRLEAITDSQRCRA